MISTLKWINLTYKWELKYKIKSSLATSFVKQTSLSPLYVLVEVARGWSYKKKTMGKKFPNLP